MTYPVNLYCSCGDFIEHKFATESAAEFCLVFFKREHDGDGHTPLMKHEFLRMKRQGYFNRRSA